MERVRIAGLAFVLGWILASFSAHGATFSVNSLTDAVDANPGDGVCASAAGQCTLRAAVQESNASAGADTITVPAGTYNLTIPGAGENAAATGDLDFTDDVVINGGVVTNSNDTVIDGGGAAGSLQDRIIDVVGVPTRPILVIINGVTIKGGYLFGGGNGGGGICNHCMDNMVSSPTLLPSLRLAYVNVRDNFSDTAGAGISNHATLAIDDSIIELNYTPWGSPATGISGFGGGMGGAIMNWGGAISIKRTTLRQNYAQTGGAIYNQDTFVGGIILVLESSIIDNFADMGGGIYNVAIGEFNFAGRTAGTVGLTINRSTIANNYGQIDGGGIYNQGIGTINLINSTVTLNRSGGGPGGVFNGSVFPNRGGGIYDGGRILDVLNSTIAGNESAATRVSAANSDGSRGGDEIFINTTNAGGDPNTSIPMVVNFHNSIIGDATGTDDNCNGPAGYQIFFSNSTNNLDSGSTCSVAARGLPAADPMLGPLADNGGPTQTRMLLATSSAVHAGASCPSSDQRGVTRAVNCDLGAVEGSSTAVPPPVTSPPPITQPPAPSPNPTPVPPPAPVPQPPPVTPPPPANTAPVARDGALAVTAGSSTNSVLVAIDAEQNPLTFRLMQAPGQGTVTITNATNGAYTFSAPANATGTDTFTFVANDGQLDSNVATVAVSITAAPVTNTPPVAIGGSLSTPMNTVVSGAMSGVDADGNSLTYRIVTQPAQGLLSAMDAATGAFTYQPNTGVTGADSFTFVVNDGQVDSNAAIFNITITAANAPPSAGDGTLSVNAGAVAPGTLVGSDPNSDPLTYAVVSDARKGTVLITDPLTGAFAYTAAANASGTDTFTFKVSDGQTDSNVATVTVSINANAPPSAGNGQLSVPSGGQVVSLLSASDPDGDVLQFQILTPGLQAASAVTGSYVPTQLGSVVLTDATTGAFRYVPAAGSTTGVDTFSFVVSDGQTQSAPAQVSVSIGQAGVVTAATNTPPQAFDVTFALPTTRALANRVPATDLDGDNLVYQLVRQPAQGTLQLSRTGAFYYQANAGASGVDTFLFTATDGVNTSNTAVAKIVLDPSSITSEPPAADNSGAVGPKPLSGGGGRLDAAMLGLLCISLAGMVRRRRSFCRIPPRTR